MIPDYLNLFFRGVFHVKQLFKNLLSSGAIIPLIMLPFFAILFLFVSLFPPSSVSAEDVQPRAAYNVSAVPFEHTGTLSNGRPDNITFSSGFARRTLKVYLSPYGATFTINNTNFKTESVFSLDTDFNGTVYFSDASTVSYTIGFYEYLGRLSAPVISLNGSTLSWSAVDNAVSYHLYRDGTYFRSVSSTSTELVFNGEPAYGSFIVVAVNPRSGYVESARSNVVSYTAPVVTTPLESPVVSLNGSTLSWPAVDNATNYQIWYSRQNIQQSFNRVVRTASLSYDVVADGFYLVTALSSDSSFSESARSNVVSYTAPVVTTPLESPVVSLNGSTLSWPAVDNAVAYRVDNLTTYDGFQTIYTSVDISGYGYGTYSVFAIADVESGYTNSQPSNIVAYAAPPVDTQLPAPVISFDPKFNMIIWDSVPNATGYMVYSDVGYLTTVDKPEFSVPSSGKYYVIATSTLSGYSNSEPSNIVDVVRSTVQLSTPILSVSSDGKLISWSAVPNADYYTIYYSQNGSIAFSEFDVVTGTSFVPPANGFYKISAGSSSADYSRSNLSNFVSVTSMGADGLNPLQFILDAANAFLSVEPFGNGFTFGNILMISFGLILLGFAIKIFLGG